MEPPIPLADVLVRRLALSARVALAAAALATAAMPALASSDPPSPSPAPSAAPTPAGSPAPAGSPTPSAAPTNDLVPIYVKGQILTIAAGYVIFTSGDAVRIGSDVTVPKGVTTGSYVRVTIDQLTRSVSAVELEPKITLAGEIDAGSIPRQYVVVSPKSAPLPVAAGASGPLAHGPVTITIVVHVPGNTPATDDVYLSTDRSSYNPSEVPMQRVDGTTFSVAVTVASGTTLKYEFTRGTYATVERDRTGGIVTPRPLNVDTAVKTEDTVARWADLS